MLIDRLRLDLALAAADERARLAEHRVRDAVMRRFDSAPRAESPSGDGPIVFIERLRCECAVSTAWGDDAIGDAVARALAAALERAPQQDGAVVFRDRTELLAALLAALGEGSAWSRWWFEEFDGLKPLGASAAIRTAVLDAGEDGIAALARLTDGTASQVVRTLSAGDAARVLAAIGKRQQSAAAEPFLLWRLAARLARGGGKEASAWLCVLIASERSSPGTAGPATIAELRAMTQLRELAVEGGFDPGTLAADARLACLQALAQRCDAPSEWLDRLSEPQIAAVVAELEAPRERSNGQKQSAGLALQGATRYGGAFVLLKAIDRLGWIERWRQTAAADLPQPDADTLARALCLEVAARALAPRAIGAVVSDPALTLAFDVTGGVPRKRRALARRALRATGSPAAALLVKSLAERIVGLAGSSPAYLRKNALCVHATVERDGECVSVALGRAPLDVLLTLSGARRGSLTLPGGARIEMREAAT